MTVVGTYPGTRRGSVETAPGRTDRQVRPRYTTIESYVNVIGVSPDAAKLTFRRDGTIRQFGKKALRKLILPKHPLLKALDAAEIVYDLAQFITEPASVPVPRDPDNAYDMALEVPFADYSVGEWGSGDHDSLPAYWTPGTHRWYKRDTYVGHGYSDRDGTMYNDPTYYDDEGARNVNELIVPSQIAGTVLNRNWQIGHYVRYDHEDPDRDDGTWNVESWTSTRNGTVIDFANPPRVVEVPGETITRVIPRTAPPAEKVRWREIPRQRRHPWSVEGPAAQPKPQPQPSRLTVPPRIVIAPKPDTVVPDREPIPSKPAPNKPPPANTDDPVRAPPGPKVKERKAKIKHKGILMGIAAVEQVPELLDTVNALWKALPKSCQSGYFPLHDRNGKIFYKRRFRASQAQRIGDLKRCWLHMDLQKALEAIVGNIIEDKAYGKFGKIGAEAGMKAGMDRGLMFGSWDTFVGALTNKEKIGEGISASPLPDFDAGVKWVTREGIPRIVSWWN